MNFARARERRKWERRQCRSWHVGNDLYGTCERPRLSVYRSNRHFHCQIIDDSAGRTLAAASTLMKGLREQVKNGGDKKAAALVGQKLAEVALSRGIKKVVFDRNMYRFHGRVRAFAEAAAKGGLEFLVNPDKKERAPKAPKVEKPSKSEKPAKAPKEAKPGAGAPKGGKPSDKAQGKASDKAEGK
jgi:large subunit ribosomal protein L18